VRNWLIACLGFLAIQVQAQDDLDAMMANIKPEKVKVKNAFKSTRILNFHSTEMVAGGVLDFRILHRFGRLNSGVENLFGLDQAFVRLSLDYGLTDNITVGLGRSAVGKEVDGFVKWRFLQQSKGPGAMPVSLVYVAGSVINTASWANPDRINFFSSRLSFYHQLLISRKFSEDLTLQLSPIWVHRNLVPANADQNGVFGLGIGGRMKLSKRISFNADYCYIPDGQMTQPYKMPLSLGFDIETGGHVFQLQFSNALGMNEKALVTQTTGDWLNGDIHFGFNISRVFTLKTKKAFDEAKKSSW
jgi:hypothetical protein